jgi:hypothetical protein
MWRYLIAGFLALALTAPALGGEGKHDPKTKVRTARWTWSEREAPFFDCVASYLTDYDVRITRAAGGRYRYQVTVFDGKVEVCSFPAHLDTVFVQVGDVLFVTDFSPTRMGCAVVAFDLKKRKELWRTELNGNPPGFHSEYRHQVNIADDGGLIVVYGKESHGRYIEFLDPKTGKIVSARKLPPEWKPEHALQKTADEIPDR